MDSVFLEFHVFFPAFGDDSSNVSRVEVHAPAWDRDLVNVHPAPLVVVATRKRTSTCRVSLLSLPSRRASCRAAVATHVILAFSLRNVNHSALH